MGIIPAKQSRSIAVTGEEPAGGAQHIGDIPFGVSQICSYKRAKYAPSRNMSVGTRHRHKPSSNISTKQFLTALISVTYTELQILAGLSAVT